MEIQRNAMYKILGADGREYGPASLEQVKQWIAEGRINSLTRLQVAGSPDWKPAAEVPEVNGLLIPPAFTGRTPGPEPPVTPGPGISVRRPRQGLAITSFVLGVAAFALCLGIFTGIPAMICGQIARKRARRAPAEFGGAGLAMAGQVLGYLSVAYMLLIAILLLPSFGRAPSRSQTAQCTSHMKQIGLALRVWGVDHEGQFPFNVSTNAGGTKELCETGYDGFDKHATVHLAVISKELGNPAVLLCPADRSKRPARDFEHLEPGNVSYLLRTGPEVTDTNLAEILLKCPLHGTVLHCDGNVELKRPGRRLRL
ncbi:MAG TPA: DUF4190 domain-containing protein [Verrucomicrobiae bacterium]